MFCFTFHQVTFSMLEIYNEQVRDLLKKGKPPSGGLKVKESPGRGFYGKFWQNQHCPVAHKLNCAE